jgi:hypothetical protein
VISLWLAVVAFYAVVLLVGLGVMLAATGTSVLMTFRRGRAQPVRRSQLAATTLLALAGATAVGVALLWFGRIGGDVLAAALATF